MVLGGRPHQGVAFVIVCHAERVGPTVEGPRRQFSWKTHPTSSPPRRLWFEED